jgi:hypothetical protein
MKFVYVLDVYAELRKYESHGGELHVFLGDQLYFLVPVDQDAV